MKIRNMLARPAVVCVAAVAMVSSLTGLAAADDTDNTKPVATADVFNGLYATKTYDLTAKMLMNDTGNGGVLTICFVSQPENPNVKITLVDNKVTAKLLSTADGQVATFTSQTCEDDNTDNPSDPVTNTINVKHVYPMVVHKIPGGKKVEFTNKNDRSAKVRLRWKDSPDVVDMVFTVPAHSSKVVPRKHRHQRWEAWSGKLSFGYGDIY
ncbi:MAG: hypothetical protein JWN82_645 [Candidatus Saccharibacteria bacterium]|nr:hypothetical protein [Candidatus Saccharibacteria bacterium]